MKNFVWLLIAALMAPFFVACEESEVEGEFANWQKRNQLFIDSIAAVAEADNTGRWKIFKNYLLPPDDPNDLSASKDVNDYVYCYVEQEGEGIVSPMVTDSTRVNYRVWLLNGDVLDQSFRGEFDASISVPAKFGMYNMITGWTTALLHMHVGDVWTVYMPYSLAYGTTGSGSAIPGYSALKYWINLVGVYPLGTVVSDWQ